MKYIILFLTVLVASPTSFACNVEDEWAALSSQHNGSDEISIESAIRTLAKNDNVRVELSMSQPRCSQASHYTVFDNKNDNLLNKDIPVPAGTDGRTLMLRVGQLLKQAQNTAAQKKTSLTPTGAM